MPLVVVKSQIVSIVKETAKQQNSAVDNITSDFAPALDKKVRELIAEAVRRASANNRRTLMGRDV
jgi:histone H3/H4